MAKKKLKARGNFRRVTPAVAEKYIKFWAKKGVSTAKDIPAGKDQKVQQIRLREALFVKNEFDKKMAAYAGEKATYDSKLAEFKALGKNKVFENAGIPAKYLRPKAPVKPTLTGPRSVRGGNFKKVSKKHSKRYLARLFNRGSSPKDKRPLGAYAPGSHEKRNLGNATQFTARVNEAATLLGPAEVAKMFVAGEKNRNKREVAAVKKIERTEKAKKTRDSNKLNKLNKQLANLDAKRKKLVAAGAGASRARRARRSRRLRRRAR